MLIIQKNKSYTPSDPQDKLYFKVIPSTSYIEHKCYTGVTKFNLKFLIIYLNTYRFFPPLTHLNVPHTKENQFLLGDWA